MAKTDVLIKHRNCIQNQKSIWNSQVSLPAVTPFPSLGGKHISVHKRPSSWGWNPRGCSDFLQQIRIKETAHFHGLLPVPFSFSATSAEQRWIFLQHLVSRGTLLSPHAAELFTGFRKPERSFSTAELTASGLLYGSLLPNRIKLKPFSPIVYARYKVAPEASLASHWGGRSWGLAIALSCPWASLFMMFFVPENAFPALSAWRAHIHPGRISSNANSWLQLPRSPKTESISVFSVNTAACINY